MIASLFTAQAYIYFQNSGFSRKSKYSCHKNDTDKNYNHSLFI
ncbi:hypothetical protein CUZ56_01493 [Saezia sanguinis]|jgi:hypothetical protein|uniref:Uncharacterized protein n=1 Tax=Saezia sanguinis TaxID=1965230 RepID=A0A433SD81_9BURK|nr:hypothetical protein CUZ56_01493 [Saezia sanguinis]